ncbi:ADP-ribosylglycohydrolase family protein [Pseudonocardiaceae bacterium YIM PH 21723]|nr:ADP-ribosylglycohydrolase family protein [Pseudonocardiaceae bacterium YIM PH 21723]
MPNPATLLDRGVGCLLGGALGDALGAPVEFARLPEIRAEHGRAGITEPPRPALITDDTQITMFTAEGYLAAWVRGHRDGVWQPMDAAWRSYRRWLTTQQAKEPDPAAHGLLTDKRLYASRAPGLTGLRALTSNEPGSLDQPRNDAQGCGAVARSAPAGFAPTARRAYDLGCELGALTHGHPSGWAPAGALAMLIHLIAVRGRTLAEAVDQVTGRVLRDDQPTALALAAAVKQAAVDRARIRENPSLAPWPASIEQLGQGWTGPESLSIAVYAALAQPAAQELAQGLRIAVNHSGASASTAAIAGNILGALHGRAALPREWLVRLELADALSQLGLDLASCCSGVTFEHDPYLIT